jgi:hypothetical protein
MITTPHLRCGISERGQYLSFRPRKTRGEGSIWNVGSLGMNCNLCLRDKSGRYSERFSKAADTIQPRQLNLLSLDLGFGVAAGGPAQELW